MFDHTLVYVTSKGALELTDLNLTSSYLKAVSLVPDE